MRPRRFSLMRVVGELFSFEALFVLYLFAGRYKADPRFEWVPVDLTAMLFGLSVVAGFFVLLRRGFRFQRDAFVLVLLYFGFAIYIFASLTWSPGIVYARRKTFYFATLTFWVLIACAVIISQDIRRLRRFLLMMVIFSFWVAIESLLVFVEQGGSALVYALSSNYGGISALSGTGLLIVLIYLLFFASNWVTRTLSLMLITLFGMTLIITGAKGPFLGTAMAAMVPFFFGFGLSKHKGPIIRRHLIPNIAILGLSVGIISYLFILGNLGKTLIRIQGMLEQPLYLYSRWNQYAFAIKYWAEQPIFGHGIGSWPILKLGADIRLFPHNILLEILVELGIVGLLIFLILVGYALYSLKPLWLLSRNPLRILLIMLFIHVFFDALVNNDISENRILFGVLGLTMFARLKRTQRPRIFYPISVNLRPNHPNLAFRRSQNANKDNNTR